MHWPSWKAEVDLKSVQAYLDLAFEWRLISKRPRPADLIYEFGR